MRVFYQIKFEKQLKSKLNILTIIAKKHENYWYNIS